MVSINNRQLSPICATIILKYLLVRDSAGLNNLGIAEKATYQEQGSKGTEDERKSTNQSEAGIHVQDDESNLGLCGFIQFRE